MILSVNKNWFYGDILFMKIYKKNEINEDIFIKKDIKKSFNNIFDDIGKYYVDNYIHNKNLNFNFEKYELKIIEPILKFILICKMHFFINKK